MGKPTTTNAYNRAAGNGEATFANLRGDLADIPRGEVAVDVMKWDLVGGVAEHRFLRFTFMDGGTPRVLDIHGLATDRETGATRPIGFPDKDNICIWPVMPDVEKESKGSTKTGHLERMGTFSVADAQRMMIIAAVGGREINNLDIEYRALRTNIPLYDPTTNSNAASRTLLELMGLDPSKVSGGWAPGATGRLLPLNEGDHGLPSIEGLRDKLENFSNQDIKGSLPEAFRSLLGSVPQGDGYSFSDKQWDEYASYGAWKNELETNINSFFEDMDQIRDAPTPTMTQSLGTPTKGWTDNFTR